MKNAVANGLRWQLYKKLLAEDQHFKSPLRNYRPEHVFPDGLNPQVPDVYLTYLQCKRWNTLWWDGALAEQPHILMAEFDACAAGDDYYQTILRLDMLALATPPQQTT